MSASHRTRCRCTLADAARGSCSGNATPAHPTARCVTDGVSTGDICLMCINVIAFHRCVAFRSGAESGFTFRQRLVVRVGATCKQLHVVVTSVHHTSANLGAQVRLHRFVSAYCTCCRLAPSPCRDCGARLSRVHRSLCTASSRLEAARHLH
jgi:hypothetical protein